MDNVKIQSTLADIFNERRPEFEGRTIIFLDEECIPLIAGVGAIKEIPSYLAVKEPERVKNSGLKVPPERLIDRAAPGLVDRLKILTGGRGFEIVIVLSRDPEAVKLALGAAAVFGDIYLLFASAGQVAVDLTATVNFKSLRIHGRDITRNPELGEGKAPPDPADS